MDNQRTFLFIALVLVMMMLWQAWQRDYGPQPPQTASAPSSSEMSALPDLTGSDSTAIDIPDTGQLATTTQTSTASLPKSAPVRVFTDLFDLEIDTVGGTVKALYLLRYPVAINQPELPFQLFSDQAQSLFIAQSGLVAVSGGVAPDHHALFETPTNEYRLAADQNQLRVPLRWEKDGIVVTKTYVFQRGKYDINIEYAIGNKSTQAWIARPYQQFQRSRVEREQAFIYTYTGGVIYGENQKYEKVDFDDMDSTNLRKSVTGGWTAMIQHYFLGAWIERNKNVNEVYTKVLKDGPSRYIIGMIASQPVRVEPGSEAAVTATLYAGPKIQKSLEELAPGLELTVDYGVLTFIAKPLFWFLGLVHKLLGNWGWAIIFVTLFIKLLFYKLSETSYKSMANMRKLTPRLQSIKERYGDDRQKLNQAMMDLYKKEKINPLGGCLPILVQIPVFIALYWVLLESVELRQAPFILWIKDLSIKDPYFVLPVIMGVTMFVQQRLNPAPIDPIQQKVMMVLPFVFTVFFAFFPAGLVLYWVVNNMLSIGQQYIITKRIESGTVKS